MAGSLVSIAVGSTIGRAATALYQTPTHWCSLAIPIRLASVTKQLTATAVLLLAERGKLSLDDPPTRFFPGFAKAAHGVQVRHLLGHTP